MKKIIDSHVHLDLIEKHHPRRIPWLQEHNCAVVSWSYFDGADSVPRLKHNLCEKAETIRRLAAAGLHCRWLAGVHPRSIPPDLRPEQIAGLLKPFLEDPLCLGIGEIGLETGSHLEREVLTAQLELGRRLTGSGKVIGVHTPRLDKVAITAVTLKILAGYGELAPQLVVDHCTPATIMDVLDRGFWAGVTLSTVKTSWGEMKQMVAACRDGLDRIMCNTDSGSDFFEAVVTSSRAEDLPPATREKLFYANAARFSSIVLPGDSG